MKKNVALMALTGILTLASCSQTPDTTDNKPTVSFNSQSNITAGATVTLSGTVSDDKGVQKVVLTSSNSGPICTAAVSGGNWSCTVTAPSPTASTTYSYTVTATDTAGQTASSTGTVQVNATGTGGGGGGGTTGFNVNITSPGNADSAKVGVGTLVKFTANQELKSATCSLNGTKVADATVTGTSGYCTVTPSAAGNGVIRVDAVSNATGNPTAFASVGVIVAGVGDPVDPRTSNGIAFDAAQELKASERGLVGEVKDANGRWVNVESGWRYLGQAISTPESPNLIYPVYVKGKNLNVTFTNPGGNANLIEAFYVRTTGSKTPTSDDVQAAQKIQTASNSSTLSFTYDTTRMAEFESTLQWIVIRVNGTTLYTRPVVTDNHAPQPAVADFAKGSGDSNILPGTNYVSPLGTPYTWARGNVHIFTANTQLEDNLFGPAPTGSSPAYRVPAGFESVTYYLVPDADAQRLITSDANAERRAAMVRQYATTWTKPVLGAADGVAGSKDFRIDFSSTEGYGGLKPVEGVVYRVYAITRDQLGNDVASPTSRAIRFDNTGPVITGASLCDISPLPYVSTEPCRYISDVAALRIGGIADAGVGVETGTYTVNLGSYPIATLDQDGNIVWSSIATGGIVDTNLLSDGKLPFNFSRATDLLGNPAVNVPTAEVIIDNTDPTVDLHSPVNGVYKSGERITSESNAKDANVDASGVYQNLLFWDDTEVAAGTDTNAAGINRAVEFARSTAPYAEQTLNLSVNRDFLAPYNASVGGTQKYYVTNVAIDRAGNAVMSRNPITVKPKYLPLENPTLGRSDAFNKRNVMNLGPTAPFTIQATGFNGTNVNRALQNARINLASSGTSTQNSGPSDTSSNTAAEILKAVTFYGQYNFQDWDKIVNYLTGDRDGQEQYITEAGQLIRNGTLTQQRNAVRLLLDAMRDRVLSADENTALVAAGFNGTLLAAANADGIITPFTPGGEPQIVASPNDVLNYNEQQLRDLFNSYEADALVENVIDTTNAQAQAVITNIRTLFIDPSLARQAQLGSTRNQVEGWNETAQPWMRLGESTATQGLYGMDTDVVNNLYFMQDHVAVSVPNTRYYHGWLSPFYSTVGVDGRYDALTGIAQDTAGTYNAFGEYILKD